MSGEITFENYSFNLRENREIFLEFIVNFQRKHKCQIEKIICENLGSNNYKLNSIEFTPTNKVLMPKGISSSKLNNTKQILIADYWYLNY